MVSQLFLGIRLECAKCHHHPFESWGQEEFYSSPPTSPGSAARGPASRRRSPGGEEIVFTAKSGAVKHPLTARCCRPGRCSARPRADDDPEADPREALARWMTAPDNPYFARVIVNRVWADLMGRGIVEPVDDLRATNPPSNGPLLDALADDFRTHGYDLKQLIRTIMTSSGLRPELRAERAERGRHPQLLAPLPPAAPGRGAARRGLRRDRRARDVRRRAARFAAAGDLDRPRRRRCSSTPSAGPTRTRIRPASGRPTRRSSRRST